ncbi:hypothetical protein KAK06_18835 [Ideonella sp. 4Y11]|uniref:Type I restriction modification DNA specificity domain-containing protein n=1 Tax=Ideonella aquatica TaxID=2824119 RepID=A0A941BMM8_9BURK|nr:hypothetical protein [Ideonella aquatica]MBQ0961019.1 hypothetical protein [Ideonella aquatica]
MIEVSGGSAASGQHTGRSLLITTDVLQALGGVVIPASFCRLLRLDAKVVDPGFVVRQIDALHQTGEIAEFENQSTGIANFQFTRFVASTHPCIDGLASQQAIDDCLTSFDQQIALNRRINQTLEAMAQAIFKSWFVDFDPVKAKIAAKAEGSDSLRAAMSAISGKADAELDAMPSDQRAQLAATAALFPDELAHLPSGDVPAGWSMKPLAELTDKIGSGATPRGGKEVYQDEGIALIRSQNVYDSLFVWEGLARITDEAAEQLKGVTVQEGDVLLNITGASILRTCVVLPDVLPARVNQHVAIIRAKAGVPPRFLHQHLLLAETKNFLLGLNAGASREAITKGHIESLAVLVPSPDLLMAFHRYTAPMFRQVECCARQMRALAETRDSLLPKLLSGELQVQQVPTEAAA